MATFSLLMKCDSCQEKATVFYTQVTDGKLKKFVLCESCAQKKGITSVDGLLMGGDLLGSSPPQTQIPDLIADLNQEDCSACGFTLEDFRKVGRLGCPECYQIFSREIMGRLPSMHKGGVHKGYLPEGLAKKQALESELAGLAAKLASAIEEERFEDAAIIRDEISEIEKSGKGVVGT
ncbi:UvrB/UvrC motif-containing protein [Akkermansiaceae bacterium]|jgi:protein arginine kinase activator|nr:UvrB/UvrC motif-containing protein [Akkermansiaceae bacterium]MDA7868315.1 UvrB/UvrC motif-containing protein [bacterium]MDA7907579.1 UvrB/UvrC motif-containing protein [Akkermansiaceae bacterium]MDA9830419.1 UvrB/UvrC motif-containing protein [Akkermansiaceae bacterium]MDB4357890.1 UvrB/UvrC motif-containing protein [bacterium]